MSSCHVKTGLKIFRRSPAKTAFCMTPTTKKPAEKNAISKLHFGPGLFDCIRVKGQIHP